MTPLIGYYSDDLTGSTDMLSVLTRAGVRALMFLDLPEPGEVTDADVVGIAGTSRTMSPADMEEALPAAFKALAAVGVRLVQYKVCTTFDSSPSVGSIGVALAIGRRMFRPKFVPVVVGQPEVGRWCAFGTLFAAFGENGAVFRLDRHPVMSCHPVTPMHEADLRRVLQSQGAGTVGLVDVAALERGEAATALRTALREAPDAVVFDVVGSAHQAAVGSLIGAVVEASTRPLFAIGSSGLQQALLAGWPALAARINPPQSEPRNAAGPVLVVAGSRAKVTAVQIKTAASNGFVELALDPAAMVMGDRSTRLIAEAVRHLRQGRSVVAHTSLGPEDVRALPQAGRADLDALAAATGRFARDVLAQVKPVRIGVIGGDTSGGVARALGIRALAHAWRCAPGVPVCRVRSGPLDGLEVMVKGGQMGQPDVLARLERGEIG
jgi:3-oxoisoapionate kinase